MSSSCGNVKIALLPLSSSLAMIAATPPMSLQALDQRHILQYFAEPLF
jgi:hypothetical protein